MEQGVVRHRMGTVSIEGGEVVIRLRGNRRTRAFVKTLEPWSDEIRVPLAQATVTVLGNELVVRHGGDAVQSVRCDDPAELGAFVKALWTAKLALATPKAACPQCGAPAQPIGLPCAYCGHAVAG